MQCRKALERAGWLFARQKGSHMMLVHSTLPQVLSIPNHTELDRGTLRAIVAKSGLTVDQFLELL